jgi:DNA-binding SARP family transcriptional activator
MSGVTAKAPTIDLRVLGPLEVRAAGSALPLGPRKQQVALAMLAVHAGRVVGLDELVDELWPDAPPASAVANVRSYAASIRRQLEAAGDRHDRLVRRGSGYQLSAEPDELDLFAFSSHTAKGRRALRSGDLAAGVAEFRVALTYWRGSMLTGLPLGPALAGRSAIVEDERLAITEELAEAQLALDQPDEVARILHRHVHLHPLRERAYGLLMKALCRLGDVAGALSTYAEARSALIEQLGVEPGAELRRLHRSILDGDLGADERRTVATAHRPPVVKPAELPADLVDFVGREGEIQQVIALLGASGDTAVPLCGVVGQAGVGKTSLAVHVAHRLRAEYPDGQLFVDLRGADSHPLISTEVLARFLRALGVPGQAIPHDAQERGALFRSLLADRRLLLVLDNAADEEQVQPLLPGTPSCAVLVTSRYRLPGLVGLASVDLGVLGTDSALALLDRAAGATRVRAEPAAAEELTRLCGGLPLALRVIGVKLAASPHRTLAALVERLGEERHRLDQLAHAGLAVRSSLDFSYQRIYPADRKLLRQVSVLEAPDFAAWTAAAVADQTVPVVEEGLDRLVAAHLIQIAGTDVVGQVRYRMHDLIRVYARERAAAEDPEADRLAAIRRALHHWLGLVTAGEQAFYGDSYHARIAQEIGHAVPAQAALDRVSLDPLTWIEAERVAFVSAVRQAAEVGLLAECWRLACVSELLLSHRELKDESLVVHTVALGAARRVGDRRGEAIALMALGKTESERGAWTRSRSLFEDAEAMLVAEGDEHGAALCQWELARKDRHEGRLESARHRYMAMLQACHDMDLALEALALLGLGQVQLLDENPAAAIRDLEAAMRVSGRCAGAVPRLLVLLWYGEAHLQVGDRVLAAKAFREVASWSARVGDLCGEIMSLCGLTRAALAEGDVDEAERVATSLRNRHHLLREPSTRIVASSTVASVLLAKGDVRSARQFAEDALAECRRLGAVAFHAKALDLMAEIHEATGDHEAAAAARAEAAALRPAAQPA